MRRERTGRRRDDEEGCDRMSRGQVHIEARVVEFLRTRGLLEAGSAEKPGTHFLVAASGGRDSTVLAVVMARIAAAWNARLTLATVHHGLREEADAEVVFVRDLASRLGEGFLERRVDVRGEMSRSGASVQDAARRLRYAALEDMCDEAGASVILTAHHADDQAETLLGHFLRGAGPDGLSGIRPLLGRVARPLLSVSAADIAAFADEQDLAWMEDASNARDDYRRNAIRHHIAPAITGVFGPGWVQALGDSARLHAMLSSHLGAIEDERARAAITMEGDALLVRESSAVRGISLNDSSEFEKLTVCRRALRELHGAAPSLDESFRLLQLMEAAPGASLQLRDGCTALREREGLRLFPAAEPPPASDVQVGAAIRWDAWTLAAEHLGSGHPALSADPYEEIIDLDAAGDRWRLRAWTLEDRFEPFGFGQEKAVGAFLADSGFALAQRRRIPVLEGERGIVWVCGVRLGQHAAIHPGSRRFGRLRFFITDSDES